MPRLPAETLRQLRQLLLGQERPRMSGVLQQLEQVCRSQGLERPSRATVYRWLDVVEGHRYRIRTLPEHVRRTLRNLDPDGEVPGHQLVFYCLNYGTTACMSFAAGLPWLDLHQAARVRGWRMRSRGLLDALLRARQIAPRAGGRR